MTDEDALAVEPYWNLSCADWEERLREGRSLMPAMPLLNRAEAERAVGIFNRLRLPDVVGTPPLRTHAGEWLRDIVRSVFGSCLPTARNPEGFRFVREAFVMVPKKNSKTTGGAAIMLTALLMNTRPHAEFVLVGPTQEVADISFNQASGMVDADPEGFLAKRFHVRDHVKEIVDRTTGAFLKVKTFDMKVAVGSKPAGILIDEEHVLSDYTFATRVMGQLRGGMIANPEAFLIVITTQSDREPAGVFKDDLARAREIRDGKRRGRVLPMLYEFPREMQADEDRAYREPSLWPMVHPNLGLSIDLPRLIEDYEDAREKGEEEVQRWESQHLNIEIGIAKSVDRWVGADYWASSIDERITLDYLIENCDVIVVGGDNGGLWDLMGMAVLGRDAISRRWMLWTRSWCHEDVLTKHKAVAERLRSFANDGDLVICKTPTQDVEEFTAICEKIRDAGMFPEKNAIGLDRIGFPALVEALNAAGLGGDMVKQIRQGFMLSSAIWGTERKLKDGTFLHADQPIMAWCVGNARPQRRGSAVVIDKENAASKVDPLLATFDAVMLMADNPEAANSNLDGFLSNPMVA